MLGRKVYAPPTVRTSCGTATSTTSSGRAGSGDEPERRLQRIVVAHQRIVGPGDARVLEAEVDPVVLERFELGAEIRAQEVAQQPAGLAVVGTLRVVRRAVGHPAPGHATRPRCWPAARSRRRADWPDGRARRSGIAARRGRRRSRSRSTGLDDRRAGRPHGRPEHLDATVASGVAVGMTPAQLGRHQLGSEAGSRRVAVEVIRRWNPTTSCSSTRKALKTPHRPSTSGWGTAHQTWGMVVFSPTRSAPMGRELARVAGAVALWIPFDHAVARCRRGSRSGRPAPRRRSAQRRAVDHRRIGHVAGERPPVERVAHQRPGAAAPHQRVGGRVELSGVLGVQRDDHVDPVRLVQTTDASARARTVPHRPPSGRGRPSRRGTRAGRWPGRPRGHRWRPDRGR